MPAQPQVTRSRPLVQGSPVRSVCSLHGGLVNQNGAMGLQRVSQGQATAGGQLTEGGQKHFCLQFARWACEWEVGLQRVSQGQAPAGGREVGLPLACQEASQVRCRQHCFFAPASRMTHRTCARKLHRITPDEVEHLFHADAGSCDEERIARTRTLLITDSPGCICGRLLSGAACVT
jgi:hypothetical protein